MEQRDWSNRATEHAVEVGVAYDDRGNDAPSDADSTETDPDMPTLVPVVCFWSRLMGKRQTLARWRCGVLKTACMVYLRGYGP